MKNLYLVDRYGEEIVEVSFNTEAEAAAYKKCFTDITNKVSLHSLYSIGLFSNLDIVLNIGYPIYDENGVELYCSAADEDDNAIS